MINYLPQQKGRVFSLLWLGPFVIFSVLSVGKYTSLHSSVMDFGVFLSHFHNIGSLGEWWRAILGHTQPYLLPYSWFYLLLPQSIAPQAMLIIQALWLALPTYWLWRWCGWLGALAYLFYFPLWFNVLFDFHMDHLAVPLLVGFFLLANVGRLGWAVGLAIALALVKEPFALQTAACGLYLICRRSSGPDVGIAIPSRSLHSSFAAEARVENQRSQNIRVVIYGSGLMVFGLGYFYTATSWVLPFFLQDASAMGAFSWLGQGVGEITWYVLTHPLSIVEEIVTTPGKVVYLLVLFGALCFIPLLYPTPLLVALPILAISLLSHWPSYYGLGHHYTAGLIAPMIFSFVGGVSRVRVICARIKFSTEWFGWVLVIGLLAAHVTLAPSPIGRLFWSPKVWAYHYEAYLPTDRNEMIKMAIEEHVSVGLEMVVSVQNTLNWAPLTRRRYVLTFPEGVSETISRPMVHRDDALWPPVVESEFVLANYVLLDESRPWFLFDKGCEWLYGKCLDQEVATKYLEWVAKAKQLMRVAFEEDGFVILYRPD